MNKPELPEPASWLPALQRLARDESGASALEQLLLAAIAAAVLALLLLALR